MTDELSAELPSPADGRIDAEFAATKVLRSAADFGLQSIQRAVLLATIQAAASVTGSVFVGLVGDITLLLFFAWSTYSIVGSVRWVQIKLRDRPSLRKGLGWLVATSEIVLIGILTLAATSFANEMAIRFGTSG